MAVTDLTGIRHFNSSSHKDAPLVSERTICQAKLGPQAPFRNGNTFPTGLSQENAGKAWPMQRNGFHGFWNASGTSETFLPSLEF